jgi:CRP/FNR family transcriptional regulator, nitrogen fixation regulation protein
MPLRLFNPMATKAPCSTRGLLPAGEQDPLEHLATLTCYAAGEPIYRQRQPAVQWHRILSGAARKCVQMPNGSRHIVDFLFPRDLFGFGKANRHGCSVEAIAATTKVASYPRDRVMALAETDPGIARQIRETAFDAICRLQLRLLILGQRTAIARVCSFILEMADRTAANPPGMVILPMSRYDIADYLALTVETISRTLTNLQLRGAIAIHRSRILQIRDRAVLARLAEEVDRQQSLLSSQAAALHEASVRGPRQEAAHGDRSPSESDRR